MARLGRLQGRRPPMAALSTVRYPRLRLSRDDFRPLGTRSICPDMKNALAAARETRMMGIIQCARRYL